MFDINGIKVNRITYFPVKIEDREAKGITEVLSHTTVLGKRDYHICWKMPVLIYFILQENVNLWKISGFWWQNAWGDEFYNSRWCGDINVRVCVEQSVCYCEAVLCGWQRGPYGGGVLLHTHETPHPCTGRAPPGQWRDASAYAVVK